MTTTRDLAYREELGRLTPRLRQIARALAQDGSANRVDDLVQSTLVRALAVEERRHGDRLLTWLLASLFSLHRAQIQTLSHQRITAGGRTVSGTAAPSPAMASIGSGPEPSPLSRVPLDDREALILIALGRLSYMQAAEILNLSITALVLRLSRARDRLAEGMERRPQNSDHDGRSAGWAPPARRPASVSHLRVVK